MATTKQLLTTITSTGAKGDAQDSMTVSTSSPDREGDRVFPSGLDATAFRRNPCLMFAHGGADRYAAIPVGSVVHLETTSTEIRAAWRWLEHDPFADRVRNAFAQGVIRAASIGFKPLEKTPNDYGGFDITKFELYEISLCAIPANAEATRALKSLGLLAWDQPALIRSASPPLSITGDRSIPRLRLRDDDVVLRLVDDRDVYRVDPVMVRDTVRDVLVRAMCEAAEVAVQRALLAAAGRVE